MLIRWMLVLIVLALTLPTLPTLTHADEYDDQIRILDLELSMLYLRLQTLAAGLYRERAFPDVQGSLMPRQRTSIEAPLEEAYLPHVSGAVSLHAAALAPARGSHDPHSARGSGADLPADVPGHVPRGV